MDYLDQRDRILTHLLERIEGRLEQMEDSLQAPRARTPQGPPEREQRRGGRKSNRSDASLRVRREAPAGVLFSFLLGLIVAICSLPHCYNARDQ